MALTKPKPKPLTKTIKKDNGGGDARRRVNNFLFTDYKIVPISSLKPHPKNPNIGDVVSIQESLDENGMYRPIVWNRRNGFIAAGHHTWLAARKSGWTEIAMVEIDVDEVAHKRIMITDNATAARAERDERIMAELLSELQKTAAGTTGMGMDPDEIDRIMAAAASMSARAEDELEDAFEENRALIRAQSLDGVRFGEEEEDDTEYENIAPPVTKRIPAEDDFEGQPDELQGAYALKPDLVFDHVGWLEIPRLRTDMIMRFDEIPDNLLAWSGSATKDWPDEDQWWLYNYGIDSTYGMKDISKVILAFYTYDDYFEKWWYAPDKYTTRVLNSGIKYAITPDFSMHMVGQESRSLSIWNLYRQRWMGRYFQEAGIRIVPNVTWSADDEKFLMDHILPTLPKRPSTIALQIQAMFEKGDKASQEKQLKRQVQAIFDEVEPQGALIYYGAQGKEFFDTYINPGCDVVMIESRVVKLAEQAKKREKKKTI